MAKIIHQRKNCIGCNACVELAFDHWRMSKKDGKSVLLGAIEKKGFYQVTIGPEDVEANKKAAEACPVKIIQILE